jgi:tetratricopeptide (TPR) repeat protein
MYQKGEWIGQRFQVHGVLGKGGFGIVYLVCSADSRNVYALKTFRDEHMADSAIRDRFRREAQLWIDVGPHPYLVRAHFVDQIEFRLFLAMEFVAPGENGLNSLEGYLRRDPPDTVQSLRWAIQFCHGMEHAHAHGIRSHRDIKPANILIDDKRNVKISDFGLASAAGEIRVPGKGGAGTPAYMPPEQFLDANLCDPRSDIYSFGVVLYQLAAGGKLPFPAPAPRDDSSKAWNDFLQEMFRLHSTVPPAGSDSPLDPVIRRCLEKKPSRRFPSFRELRGDLETLLRDAAGETIRLPDAREMTASEWNNRGMSLDQLGLHEEAGPCYEKAIALDPDQAVIWGNQANNLRDTGRYAEADACFDKALELDPASAVVWNSKGAGLLEAGRCAESLPCFEKALELRPSYAIARHNRGFAFNTMGRFPEALETFDRLLESNPRMTYSWYQKGNALLSLGRDAEADRCFAKAAELDPQYARQALRYFDRLLELNPRSAAAWYHKAQAEERLSQYRKAADSYRRFLDLAADPQSPLIALARGRVQSLEK